MSAETGQAHIAIQYHGVLPAVLTSDISRLKSSLAELHAVGFKRRELETSHPAVQALYTQLSSRSALAVGMSSMGPLLYAVSEGPSASTLTAVGDCWVAGPFAGRNGSYSVDALAVSA